MGLIVDVPKPGFGSSNDDNTCRRFFTDSKLSSEITGVDEVLIEHFGNILSALNYNEAISRIKFGEYAHETAKMFVKLYPWYDMPPSVHKVLIHGPDFIQHSLLPLGQLSEESQKARNKDFKNYKIRFAKKFSRIQTMTDIFNRFLLTSDPYITHLGLVRHCQKVRKGIPDEIKRLFVELEIEEGNKSEEKSEGESENEDKDKNEAED